MKKLASLAMALVVLLLAADAALADRGGLLWSYRAAKRMDAVALSDDGQRIALGSRDNTLRFYDRAGELLWDFRAENSILGVSVSPDGGWVAVASEDRHVYLLDGSGRLLWKSKARKPVNAAAVAADGSLVIAASDDGSFSVLDGSGQSLWQKDVGTDVGAAAIYGAGGDTRVLIGSGDGAISLYSRQGDLLLETQLGYAVKALDVTPNGGLIIAGCKNGAAYLLDGSDGRRLWSYQARDEVNGVSIANDGGLIALGSEDGTAYLLDRQGKALQSMAQDSPVLSVALSGDGDLLALGTLGGAGRVYDRRAAESSAAQVATGQRRLALFSASAVAALVLVAVWVAQRTAWGRTAWRTVSAGPRATLRSIWKARLSYLLLLPTIILLLIFNFYPAFSGLFHAFTDWKPGAKTEWIGLANFRYMLQDRFFWAGFRNMIILVATSILKALTMPLLAAELLFSLRHNTIRYGLRTLFIVPIVVPAVVEILLWNNIYDPTIGLLNQALTGIGLNTWARVWYGDPRVALTAIIFIGFPWIGPFPLLIFYGGLISISTDVFDAALVDGAFGLSRFWHIDLPLLMGQIKLLLMLTFIGAVQTFELVYLTTGGGPGAATYTPALELYYSAMRMDMLGLASAIGMVLFVIILSGTVVNMRTVKSSADFEA